MAERPIAWPRWIAKKAARAGVAAMTALPALISEGRPRLRVLTYHRFGPSRRSPFCVSADSFERQMSRLADSGKAVTLGQAKAFAQGRLDLPDGSVLVTIDDGDPSVVSAAAPILKACGVPAVLFTVAGRPDGFAVMPDADLRALAEQGIEIGSHSMTHRSMARLPRAEALREARESRERLEQVLGRAVAAFAYPFGTRADFSGDTGEVLREAGYDIAFTSQHGAVTPELDPLALPRVKVESGDPDWLFPLLTRGAMDAWRLVDEAAYGLQKPA
ncbi:MAG TPA: polysaccharide deacetylase family protein [Caulobacteraceae bacterium]|nr:polysaccharide deacetylase family protein [Caulobacteraceae bacterium]